MSDDISVPRSVPGSGTVSHSYSHSYRARRSGLDTGTRRLLIVASALGLVLLGGMGVWTFSGHRSAGVPVIEADKRPMRIKPENPGGMTVAGANDQVMGHGDGPGDAGDLAPEAERPDPQALRAQRQAASAPAAARPAPSATTGTATPPAAAVATAPAPAPAPAPATAPATAPVTASAVAPEPAAKAGGASVQIAAVDSEALAATEWQRLARKAPELLGDRKPTVVKAERDGKTFWRVRTGGFADIAAATDFCRKVRAKGLGCSIAG